MKRISTQCLAFVYKFNTTSLTKRTYTGWSKHCWVICFHTNPTCLTTSFTPLLILTWIEVIICKVKLFCGGQSTERTWHAPVPFIVLWLSHSLSCYCLWNNCLYGCLETSSLLSWWTEIMRIHLHSLLSFVRLKTITFFNEKTINRATD